MRFPDNFQIEKDLYFSRGIKLIAGLDEVGRGPLAGPLVVAAAVLDMEKLIELETSYFGSHRINDVGFIHKDGYQDVNDSKKISPNKRKRINEFLLAECLSYSIAEISHTSIDGEGMSVCISRAFEDALSNLNVKPEFIITDMVKIKSVDDEKQLNLIEGDKKSISVGAASIIAKVYRDNLMEELDKKYPLYGFSAHKGYGTKRHMEALQQYGPCEIHRKSFHPIASFLYKS